MKRETYLVKIAEAENLVEVLHGVCALFEARRSLQLSATYRAAMDELTSVQAYIDRTKKKIGK